MQYGPDDGIMPLVIEESVAEGYCLVAANLFDIQFNQFPCLILFRDIRLPAHILVTLKGLLKLRYSILQRLMLFNIRIRLRLGQAAVPA